MRIQTTTKKDQSRKKCWKRKLFTFCYIVPHLLFPFQSNGVYEDMIYLIIPLIYAV